jgi:hypothetical protein
VLANLEPMALEPSPRFGPALSCSSVCLTEFAPVAEPVSVERHEPAADSVAVSSPVQEATSSSKPTLYGPAQWARPSFTKGFAGSDFVPQPDVDLTRKDGSSAPLMLSALFCKTSY